MQVGPDGASSQVDMHVDSGPAQLEADVMSIASSACVSDASSDFSFNSQLSDPGVAPHDRVSDQPEISNRCNYSQ